MKIYRIKNIFGKQIYVIASNIDNAIKIFEEEFKKNEEDINIKEIEFISFCVIGE